MIEYFEFLSSCSANRAATYMFFTLLMTYFIFTSISSIINTILSVIIYKIDSKKKDESE